MTRLEGVAGAVLACAFAASGVAFAQQANGPLLTPSDNAPYGQPSSGATCPPTAATPPPQATPAPQATPVPEATPQPAAPAPTCPPTAAAPPAPTCPPTAAAPPAPPAPTCPSTTVQIQPPVQQPRHYMYYQPPAQTQVTAPATTTVVVPWYNTWGVAITGGGGAEGFTGSAMRNTTSVGGSWNVRATIGTRQFLALEGMYIGSAQSIDALGLSNHALLIGNGAQGDVRLNFTSHHIVQPFMYGGAAWRHYSLTNTSFNTSDVVNNENVFETPVGLGVAVYIPGGFMFDVRGEYRWSWGGHLLAGQDDLTMDRWGVNGNLGFQF